MKTVDTLKTLTFAWWNTGLAPRAKSREDSEAQAFALEVIELLIEVAGADFIALGEVSHSDISYFNRYKRFDNYLYVSAVVDIGRTKVDLGYVVNADFIEVVDDKNVSSFIDSSEKTRIAQSIVLIERVTGSTIFLFISHWPSRLHGDAEEKRISLSVSLRSKVDEILSSNGTDSLIVLLGDYNDEPFDRSLNTHLQASRDRNLVKNSPRLLYNPFWGLLGDVFTNGPMIGSYYYGGGKTTKWYVFDQIMFSHGFIKADKWALSKDGSYIFSLPKLMEKIVTKGNKFDHLPVFGTVERI